MFLNKESLSSVSEHLSRYNNSEALTSPEERRQKLILNDFYGIGTFIQIPKEPDEKPEVLFRFSDIYKILKPSTLYQFEERKFYPASEAPSDLREDLDQVEIFLRHFAFPDRYYQSRTNNERLCFLFDHISRSEEFQKDGQFCLEVILEMSQTDVKDTDIYKVYQSLAHDPYRRFQLITRKFLFPNSRNARLVKEIFSSIFQREMDVKKTQYESYLEGMK